MCWARRTRPSWQGCAALDNKSDGNQLQTSIKKTLFDLPDDTYVICGHGGSTTIGEEKRSNPIVGAGGGRSRGFW